MGRKTVEAAPGFEPGNRGFADPCLASWLRRLARGSTRCPGTDAPTAKWYATLFQSVNQRPPAAPVTPRPLQASPAISPKSFTDAQSAGSPDCHLPGGPDHDRHQAADGAVGSTPAAPAHARVRAAAVADGACGPPSPTSPAPADRDAPVRAHARPGPDAAGYTAAHSGADRITSAGGAPGGAPIAHLAAPGRRNNPDPAADRAGGRSADA